MHIHESAEDYLEAILRLREQKGFVRSVDVANALDFTKASISRAMRILKENGVHSHLCSDHTHYWEDGGATYHTKYTTWEGFRGQEGCGNGGVPSGGDGSGGNNPVEGVRCGSSSG